MFALQMVVLTGVTLYITMTGYAISTGAGPAPTRDSGQDLGGQEAHSGAAAEFQQLSIGDRSRATWCGFCRHNPMTMGSTPAVPTQEIRRMKKLTVLLVVAGMLSMLAGCKEDKPAEVVQTVDWYKAHKTERGEVQGESRRAGRHAQLRERKSRRFVQHMEREGRRRQPGQAFDG